MSRRVPTARPRGGLRTGVLLAVVTVLAILPAPAVGQGTVHGVSFEADFTVAPGVARVRVVYELRGLSPGDAVPVSVLDFGGFRAENVRLGAFGGAAPLGQRHGAERNGTWTTVAGTDGEAALQAVYDVPVAAPDRSGRILSHLPVLVVELAPQEARPGLFRGRITVPAEWGVSEGFPTGMTLGPEPGTQVVELAVVPSVVTLRARTDGRSALTLPLVLDVLALAVLLVTAAAGWRHMREPVL